MFIFLYGEDSFRSKEKLKELIKKFQKEIDFSNSNILIFEGEKIDINKLEQAILTDGFLAKKRMIIIKNLFSQCQNDKFLEKILNILNQENENILIFWEKEKIDIKNNIKKKIFEKLKKEKFTWEFSILIGIKLKDWVKKRIENQGAKIENQALENLIIMVSSDLWRMSNEINKLCTYKLGEVIYKEDVDLLVAKKINENIFNLVDALGNKNKILALKLINDQLKTNNSVYYLLAMIIRQFRILLQIKDLSLKNESANWRTQLKLHPFVIQKASIQANKYSFDQLKNIYQQLLEIDIQLKTSQINSKILLNLFIQNL
ncbi:DNA polymerase III subunit delta [Candidatus Kuenenbacteria bacterium HGW-Kuenenbacteria-1]|uniref:DNA polymerase III subunit delta n=1 Tax=Candidatus Kuenenbacteria bacterium HGW-Kuenenbacteria-1 TaxID=2013812 RepID=A0A2N1UNZ0_9BACT|nr:MAG: DNA polymerase III subunit delta [Candidatus Kuenenbacteria bacterium HGW-Kuenenbacteria-1]